VARGRKPLPTDLKVLRGNPGKRPINASEPKPIKKIPRPASWLSKEAKKVWRRTAPILFRLGVLSEADTDALTNLCCAIAEYENAVQELQKNPRIFESATGYQFPSPWYSIANQAHKQIKALLAEFGMTPSSRSRLKISPEQEKDPFEEFLHARKKA
jgi:P27 family predicted phage terminase small subunit